MEDLEKRQQVALIFGGTGGIGSQLAWDLHQKGIRLALVARNQDRLEALGSKLNAMTLSADITRPEEVQRCFDAVEKEMGALTGVVNCVGSILIKPAHLTSDQEWMDTLQLNLSTSFYIIRSAARSMMHHHGESIVLISTVAARIGIPNHETIGAAKAGVIGLALSAAATYASRGIRVNVVAPSLTDTPLSHNLTHSDTQRHASLAMHPIPRVGRPDEMARAIEWFLDPKQAWVTGQVLGVDGGLSSLRPRPEIHHPGKPSERILA